MGVFSDMWNGADYSERKKRNRVLELVKTSIPTAYLLTREECLSISIKKKYLVPTKMELIIVLNYYQDTDLEINKVNPRDYHNLIETTTPKGVNFEMTNGTFYVAKYKLTIKQLDFGKVVYENSGLINYEFSDNEFKNTLEKLILKCLNTKEYKDLYNKYGIRPI